MLYNYYLQTKTCWIWRLKLCWDHLILLIIVEVDFLFPWRGCIICPICLTIWDSRGNRRCRRFIYGRRLSSWFLRTLGGIRWTGFRRDVVWLDCCLLRFVEWGEWSRVFRTIWAAKGISGELLCRFRYIFSTFRRFSRLHRFQFSLWNRIQEDWLPLHTLLIIILSSCEFSPMAALDEVWDTVVNVGVVESVLAVLSSAWVIFWIILRNWNRCLYQRHLCLSWTFWLLRVLLTQQVWLWIEWLVPDTWRLLSWGQILRIRLVYFFFSWTMIFFLMFLGICFFIWSTMLCFLRIFRFLGVFWRWVLCCSWLHWKRCFLVCRWTFWRFYRFFGFCGTDCLFLCWHFCPGLVCGCYLVGI